MARKGLGLGLGLGRKGQQAFTGALQGGQDAWTQYMAAHPNVTRRLGALETKRPGSKQGQTWAGLTQQYGIQPIRPPAPGAAPPPAPPTTTPPLGPPDPDWYKKFVSNYELPMPPELTTAGQTATENLKRLNALPLPSYQEQFATYKDLMERELDKQTADLTEAYGARGGRYTSDLTTAAQTMRRQGLQDLSAQGITAMTNLNQQRMQELGGTMQVLQGVGVDRANLQQQAAQTAWQNYLMATSPPEMMDKMLQWSAAFSPPGSVITQK